MREEGRKEGLRAVRAAMLEFLSPCDVSSSGAALKPVTCDIYRSVLTNI